jgi:hypothetical protein
MHAASTQRVRSEYAATNMPTHAEVICEQFEVSRALLATHIAEPALCAEIALLALEGSSNFHFEVAAQHSLPMLRASVALYGITKKQTERCYLTSMYADAVQCGNLATLRYLHERGFEWESDATEQAAVGGHLDCLKYLDVASVRNGCPWHEGTINKAIKGGHRDCLQYAHENGCPWDPDATYTAAWRGDLASLRYLHKHGCPWHPATTYAAAKRGHLKCLKFAAKRGCPWHESTVMQSSAECIIYCLKYVGRAKKA